MTTLEGSGLQRLRAARARPRRRLTLVLGGLTVAVVAAFWWRVLGGTYTITLPDFVRIVGGQQIPGATFILMDSKLPRAVLGVEAGVAFGLAGAIFQTTLRNPLASPDVVGVSAGASAAAVFGIVVLHTSGTELSLLAMLGALGAGVVVRAMGRGQQLVLAGVTLAAGMVAVIQYLFTRADVYDAQLALRWLTGSLAGASESVDLTLLVSLAGLLPLSAYAVAATRSLPLGDDVATALGTHRHASEGLLLLGVLLTAVAVAATGPLAFVAFVAGPIARALNGGRTTFAGAALVGAVVTVVADHLGAYWFGTVNLPAGVLTGAFGAPFLLWLLTTSRRSA